MISDTNVTTAKGYFPVTVALALAGIIAYFTWGAGGFDVPDSPLASRFAMALANVFRHGTSAHLLGNLLLIGFAGYFIETRQNTTFLVAMVAMAGGIGTALELALVDDRFIGMSGIAYSMAAYALCRYKKIGLDPVWALIIAGAAVFETVHQWSEVSVFVHIGGAITGGGFAMLGGLFGGGGPRLKPMEFKHLKYVIEIINETDEDDAAEAEADLLESQFAGMFVLMERGNVLGVTGWSPIEDTDKAIWLSWTYLAEMHRGKGLGKYMVNELLKMLADQGARKMFISTSDYKENGVEIYAEAHAFYKSLGAFEELRVPAYHSADEAKIIYGLINSEAVAAPAEDYPPAKGITFTGAPHASESEGGAALTWKEEGTGVNGLAEVVRKADLGGARILVTSLPQDISTFAAADLKHHGFEKVGSLADYYAVGEAQDWWTKRLR